MQSIAPELDAPMVRIAEDQPEFIPITAARVSHPQYPRWYGAQPNTVILAFRPTDEERRRLADGADLYVSLLTFGQPMQGIIVMAGKEEAAAIYHVPAVPGPDADAWVVWSDEHGAWWKPNSRGYTQHLTEAGRYTREEAEEIARDSRGNERAFSLADAQRNGRPQRLEA